MGGGGKEGHVDRKLVKKWAPNMTWTLRDWAELQMRRIESFHAFLFGCWRGWKGYAPTKALEGHADVLRVISNYVGVVVGRQQRICRELLEVIEEHEDYLMDGGPTAADNFIEPERRY